MDKNIMCGICDFWYLNGRHKLIFGSPGLRTDFPDSLTPFTCIHMLNMGTNWTRYLVEQSCYCPPRWTGADWVRSARGDLCDFQNGIRQDDNGPLSEKCHRGQSQDF